MQAPVQVTLLTRKYYIQRVYRNNMTPNILGAVDPMLAELNSGPYYSRCWFPSFYYFVMIPLAIAFIIAEIIMLGIYYSPKDWADCRRQFDQCVNKMNSVDFCQLVRNDCESALQRPHGLYVAFIVVGSVGAAYILITLILALLVAKMEIREGERIESVYRAHKQSFENAHLNPKYKLTVQRQRSLCCPANSLPTIVVVPTGVINQRLVPNQYNDEEIKEFDNGKFEHRNFIPVETDKELQGEENMYHDDFEFRPTAKKA